MLTIKTIRDNIQTSKEKNTNTNKGNLFHKKIKRLVNRKFHFLEIWRTVRWHN